jgi:hypothetical protein
MRPRPRGRGILRAIWEFVNHDYYQSQFHSNRRYGGDWYYKFGERDGFLRLGVDTVPTYGGQAGLLPLVGLRLPLPHRQVLEITYLRDLSSQILQLHLGGVAANVAGTEIAIPAITSNMPSFKTLPSTWTRVAPSARRMLVSLVLRAATYDTTPYRPMHGFTCA